MKKLPKILSVLVALLALSLSNGLLVAFVPMARAAVDLSPAAHEKAITDDSFNAQSFSQQSLGGLVNSLNTFLIGCTDNKDADTKERCNVLLGDSAVSATGNLIAALYINQPVSGIQYFADIGSRLKIVRPAYAQTGTGFEALRPVIEIWRAFRNLAYIVFIIAFVLMGFAIMFRVKLSPQTVITIQSAIPRIVVALLLVTFSYAIAGLLIDFMYVLIGLFVIAMSPLIGNVAEAQETFISGGFGHVTGLFIGPGGGLGAANELSAVFGRPIGIVFDALFGNLVGRLIPVPGGDIPVIGFIVTALTTAAGAAYAGVTGKSIVITLILAILLLFTLFRVFILLVTSYVRIILGVILGPLQILLDILPGQSGFGGWFRNLFANILVFPLTMIFLLLGTILNASVIRTPVDQQWSPPGLGIGNPQQAMALLTFGLLLLLPNIVGGIRDAIATRPLFDFGRAVGGATTGPFGAGARLISSATDVGKSWTTRFGTRGVPNAPQAATGGQTGQRQMPNPPGDFGDSGA